MSANPSSTHTVAMNEVGSQTHSKNVIDVRSGGRPLVAVITVAIINSGPVFRRGVRAVLSDEQRVSVVADSSDVGSALAQLGNIAPDVILCGLGMVVGDGELAASFLHQRFPQAHVVVIANQESGADLGAAVKQGARGYLVSNCSSRELVDTVISAASGESLLSPAVASSLLMELEKLVRHNEPGAVGIRALSRREREVLSLVAEGLNNRAVASRLYISENTVKNHVRNIHEKLGVHNRMEAVVRAVREGLLKIA